MTIEQLKNELKRLQKVNTFNFDMWEKMEHSKIITELENKIERLEHNQKYFNKSK